MKCNQCGTEFNSNFCPQCGAGTAQHTFNQIPQPPAYPASSYVETGTKKRKKKSILKRFLIFLLVIIIAAVAVIFIANLGEKIIWDDIVLGNLLPEPPANRGEIHYNTAKRLWIDIDRLTEKQYADYIEACKEYGFTIEAKTETYSYEAYNADGYKLELDHWGDVDDMGIELEPPMEMSAITWPTGTAGKLLPVPKSLNGKISHERDDSFSVYIGETPRDAYNEYVNECIEMGFSVDYNKYEDSYSAYNSAGWHLRVSYEGFNTIRIDIDAPEDTTATATTDPPEKQTSAVITTTEEITSAPQTTTQNTADDGLSPDFKAAMDSYEAFMTDYVDFMNKYTENPSDLSLLMDYADYMNKYAEFAEDFEAWDEEDMNDAEWAYYIDVQARVSKKLLEIS